MPLLTQVLPDLHFNGDAQCFALYRWEKTADETQEIPATLFDVVDQKASATAETFSGTFDFERPIGEQVPAVIGEYRRKDNITDATLDAYRVHYGDRELSREDIFFYIYALLHHPTYRERYEADLKKMLPHIPKVAGFWEYARIGRHLADLHVNYESAEPYQVEEAWTINAPTDDWARYRVTKLAWGSKKDTSRLTYNEFLTLNGLPAGINDYQVGGRSPLEWMIDRYKVTRDTKSGILNDPNDYFREVDDPRYLVNLIKSLITVSLRTQELLAELPEFMIEEEAS